MFSWGQLDDAFLRPVKQDFTSNLQQFYFLITQVFNNNNICKYKYKYK